MVGIISEDFCRGGVFGVDVASLVFPCAAAGGPAPVCCEVGDASNEKGRGHVLCLHHGFWFAEREGFEPPEPLGSTGFQDRRNRPLCHLSGDKSSTLFPFYQIPAGISPRALPACGGRRTAFLNGRLRPRFRPAACPLSVFLPCVARAVAVSLCRRGKRSKRMFGKFLLTLSDTVRISRRRML